MMQKNIYILSLAVSMLLFAEGSMAQAGKSEVAIGYGYYSPYTFQNHLNGYNYGESSGMLLIDYRYYVSNKVTIGLGFGYENIRTDGSYLSFTPGFTYTYLDTKNDRVRVKLYGGASIGVAVYDDFDYTVNQYTTHYDNSGLQITGNATLLGIRIGRKFAFYSELGFGYKGIINGGFCYRFRTKKMQHTDEKK